MKKFQAFKLTRKEMKNVVGGITNVYQCYQQDGTPEDKPTVVKCHGQEGCDSQIANAVDNNNYSMCERIYPDAVITPA